MAEPRWVVKKAVPKENYTIEISFADGKTGVYDARLLLKEPLYEQLNAIQFFMKAHAEYDTVVWNDEIDIAPEELYDKCIF